MASVGANSTRFFRVPLSGTGFVAALLFVCATATQAADCPAPLAQLVLVKGSVELVRQGTMRLVVADTNASLCTGDTVVVHQRSQAALVLANATVVRLDQGTTVTLSPSSGDRPALLSVVSGAIYVISRTPQPFRVRTPFINANVEGTEFLVEVRRRRQEAEIEGCRQESQQPSETDRITVFEGRVQVEASPQPLLIAAGETAVASAAQGPTKVLIVRPRDAVTWTLYVPTVLSSARTLPPAIACAGQLLALGLVGDAKREMARALSANTPQGAGDAVAYALLATIAVAENERDLAREYSDTAVALDPKSAPAWLARSYAQQARFQIEGALDSVNQAVLLDPSSALAFARRAELQMSLGLLAPALQSAREAVRLDPQLSRAETVLGFASLTRIDTRAARTSFERASELDPTDPLPRLGLGLGRIREGDLAGGRGEIELAAVLDPTQSVVRSYLGKAYFEEHRDALAGQQFQLAKNLDELDPTPHFYDAILKVTENRLIEALRELERSIELNDNRAVYRSRFLLDEDLAARQVGQARIYGELGLQEAALLAGYQALALNPADYSAHRYLADVYADLPRHEIARVSELLQAQLWQPLTITPLQPQIADDHSFILRGTGPSAAGLNEFDRLFARNQATGQVYALYGGNGTKGDQVIASTLIDNVSLSAGQFYYKTDGFRENNDIQRRTLNFLAQVEISPSTSAQIELRRSENSNGDLTLTFDPDAFTLFHETIQRDLVRLGGRHMLSSSAGMIANIAHERTHSDTDLAGAPIIQRQLSSDLAEWQFMKQWDKSSLIVGLGRFISHEDNTVFGDTVSDSPSADAAYIYGNSRFLDDRIEVTMGLARERLNAFFDSGSPKKVVSPKLGFVWQPSPKTTIRAAAFKALKRRLIANASIEPTHVAGFNQLFDDFNGTKTRRVAVAADHRWSPDVAFGMEFSKRYLTVPQGSTDETFEWREREANAYLSVLLGRGVAAAVRFQYEQMRRPPDFATGFTAVDTRKLPLAMSWNVNRHATVRVAGTYVNQSGQFFDANGDPFSGHDSFFIADAGVTLRLGRYGSLTLEGRNLFDHKFRFEETNGTTATFSRRRLLFARLSLGF